MQRDVSGGLTDRKRESVLVTQCAWDSCLTTRVRTSKEEERRNWDFSNRMCHGHFQTKGTPDVLIAQTCVLGDDTNSYFIRNLWGRF